MATMFNTQSLQGRRVLVVDDNDDTLFLLDALLVRHGAEVTCASSAQAALRELRTSKPDVLVSDLSMPEVDGFELLQKVRGLYGPLPAIAFTAMTSLQDREKVLARGFQDLLTKPIDIPALIGSIERVIERSQAGNRAAPAPGSTPSS